jgi:hypothetical protein
MERGAGNVIFFTISEIFGYFRQFIAFRRYAGTHVK